MHYRFLVVVAAAALALSARSQNALPGSDYVPGEVLVKFAPGMARQQKSLTQLGARIIEEIRSIGTLRVQLPNGLPVQRAVEILSSQPNVEYAEPNYIAYAAVTPNDPGFGTQWDMSKIQCPSAWNLSIGSPSVVIAIVDTGIDLDHPDLAAKIVPGYDFVSNDSIAQDDNGHGTNCAGIAAASTNNGIGVAGVAWNCKLMPVKVLNSAGSGTYSAIANGVTYAADKGANVISMSLGGSSNSSTLSSAVTYAWNRGVVIVAAAGNNGNTARNYPAYYANCIAVASTTSSDTRSSFSTYGSWVDVAAPGSNIYNTYWNNTYATLSGTSMATPHVAGQAALIWGRFGGTNVSVRSKIESTTDYVGSFVRFGRINVYRSLQ